MNEPCLVEFFDKLTLESLRDSAENSTRRRQNFNFHDSYNEPCQKFLNFIRSDSYIRPHRHMLDPKKELLVAISGVFGLCLFDDNGLLRECRPFASEAYWHLGMAFAASVSPFTWHTVIALTNEAVLLEAKEGPFNPAAAKELALWSPEEADVEASKAYLNMLRLAFFDSSHLQNLINLECS